MGEHPVVLYVTTSDPAYTKLEARIDLKRVPRLRATPSALYLRSNGGELSGDLYLDDRLGKELGPIAITWSDSGLKYEVLPSDSALRAHIKVTRGGSKPRTDVDPGTLRITAPTLADETITVKVLP